MIANNDNYNNNMFSCVQLSQAKSVNIQQKISTIYLFFFFLSIHLKVTIYVS